MGHPFHFIHGCLPGIPHLFERGSFVPSSLREDTLPLLLYERGMGHRRHFVHCCPNPFTAFEGASPLSLSFSKESEGLDNRLILSPVILAKAGISIFSLRERDWTSTSLRLSMPSRLRPLAVILDCVWFALLTRSQSNPLRGFAPCPIETKSGALRLHVSFQGERGIRTLGPVTVSGFRDRPNRPLWHLSKVRII